MMLLVLIVLSAVITLLVSAMYAVYLVSIYMQANQ